jgi:hypothetical protein
MGHPKFRSFSIGEQVVKIIPLLGHLTSNKIKPRFSGPYTVDVVHANGVTYELSKPQQESQLVIRAHHSQLKGWIVPPDYLANHPVYRNLHKGTCELVTKPRNPIVESSCTTESESEITDPVQGESELTDPVNIIPDLPEIGVEHLSSQGFSSDISDSLEEISSMAKTNKSQLSLPTMSWEYEGAGNIDVVGVEVTKIKHASFSEDVVMFPGIRHSTPETILTGRRSTTVEMPESFLENDLLMDEYESQERENMLDSVLETLQEQTEIVTICEKAISEVFDEIISGEKIVDEYSMHGKEAIHDNPSGQNSRETGKVIALNDLNPDKSQDIGDNFDNSVAEGMVHSEGFVGFSPHNIISKERVGLLRKRMSLSPVKAVLQDAKSAVEECRRRSRSRVVERCRRIHELQQSNGSMNSSNSAISSPVRRQTRSRGTVLEYPNVQLKTLEFKTRKNYSSAPSQSTLRGEV